MFDEEVRFRKVIDRPKGRLEKVIENGNDVAGVILGGAGAFLLARYALGLDGTFSRIVVGLPIGVLGALGGLFVGDKISSPFEGYFHLRFEKNQKKLDEEAKGEKEGANVFDLEYRGKKLEFVIRPEYEKGHVFYAKANDGVIGDVAFSYQPSMLDPLKFRFGMKDFQNVSSTEMMTAFLDKTTRGLTGNSAPEVKIKSQEEFRNDYTRSVSEFVGSFEDRCTTEFWTGEGELNTTLIYKGENHETDLHTFANRASRLMNHAYKHRIKASALEV